ncbi:hypothetical protein HMPREF9420_0418 [Segatella salivae DSM 15606]|uniref:Uncharacterized protein n=1 Tax=Segatella salivae DSM 15606 TaxID=888832 RepID=E6MLQ1_9BACT|nr:hypothetical protein HMPREF9420_0418 [Segatella salivae DSM 15606]
MNKEEKSSSALDGLSPLLFCLSAPRSSMKNFFLAFLQCAEA